MRAPNRTIWLKIGTWPAFCAALLPVLVALLHLMPAIAATPAGHHEHQEHAALAGESAAHRDDCHPPDAPSDDRPQNGVAHCPLCFWLQGFHVLPAPVTAALPVPAARPLLTSWHEQPVQHFARHISSQPRAPPISPAA